MGLLDDLKAGQGEDGGGSDGPAAQAWRWEKAGDGIEGTVVRLSSRVIENHPDGYPIVVVRDAKGEEWSIHAMSTVLKNEVTDRNLRPGDEFAVIYDGKKTSGQGRQFHAFRVASKQGNGMVPGSAGDTAMKASWGEKADKQSFGVPEVDDAPPF